MLTAVFIFLRREDDTLIEPIQNGKLKLHIEQDGFYQLTLDALQTNGLPLTELDATNIHLSQSGQAVPYLIDDDSLIFYGQAPSNRYINSRAYILQLGQAGLLMSQTTSSITEVNAPIQQAIPLRLRLEENTTYQVDAFNGDNNIDENDLWFWHTLGLRTQLPIPFELTAVSDGSGTISIHLWGTTENPQIENDHDFDLIINDQKLDTIRWDGQTSYTSQTTIPASLLKQGKNTIILDNEIAGASPLDFMELNWLELVYMAPPTAVNDRLQFYSTEGLVYLDGFSGRPTLFDISDPQAPQQLTEWAYENKQAQLQVENNQHIVAIGPQGYLTPTALSSVRDSAWRNSSNQADLLIITTDNLAPALAPLVAAREAQNLNVALIPIEEIYDAFGFGNATPTALTTFIDYTQTIWQAPHPRYLLLVGDASSDYRNYLDQPQLNLIPSPMVPVQFGGETVSDARLGDGNHDGYPDLAIGRWPVQHVEEVTALVERTLAYEQGTAVNRALFTTDGTESRFADTATHLWQATAFADEHITLLNGPSSSEVVSQWNQGAWLTTYIGHGSIQRWGKEDVFTLEEASQLSIPTPPIVLQLTCLTGLFAHPQDVSLSETMLLHEQGPVLLVAATSLTLSSQQEPLALNLLENLQNPAMIRIGDAFHQAKLSLPITNNDGLREIVDTYILLGDPSTTIVRP